MKERAAKAARSDDRVAAIVGRLARVIACVVAVILPLGYFAVSYSNLIASAETEAEGKAAVVTELVSGNPEFWAYEIFRMEDLLARNPVPLVEGHTATVRDATGNVLMRVGAPLGSLILLRSHAIHESGRVVGHVEIARPMRHLIVGTSIAALLGLLLGGAVDVALRILPLGALRRVTAALYEEQAALSQALEDQRKTDTSLRESEYRLDLALEASVFAVWDFDLTTGGVRLSRHWWPILGYAPEEIPQRIEAWEKLTHPDDLATLRAKLALHFKGVEPILDAEYRMLAKSGEWRWIRTVGRVVERDAAGRALRATGTHGDVTLRKSQEERLNYLAYYDALTGAANRALLDDRLKQSLTQAQRSGQIVAVALLDLDQFNLVNESLGHEAGDQLLRQCADRLKSCVREGDTLARFAGDQFVLLLPGQTDAVSASTVATRVSDAIATAPHVVKVLQRALTTIEEPLTIGDRELQLTCSIGVSLYPQDGKDGETLLKNADAALSRAKQIGRKNFQFYTAELNTEIAERFALRLALRRAFERKEFALHYQPKTTLKTGEISGAEALLRWNRPGSGIVPPGKFVPVLEETRLIIDVGQWVMEKALEEFGQLPAPVGQPNRIAVNVSQLQLAHKDFTAVVKSVLRNSASGNVRLDLEITESFIMQDLEANIPKLRAIREMGVSIAIDDFGTGYSSLSYLAKLPIDTLKIDRAFIINVDVSPEDLAIVTAIISLARSLRLKVVAEGVETESQMKILQLMQCDEMQGYLISRPLPAGEFREWWDRFTKQGGQTSEA